MNPAAVQAFLSAMDQKSVQQQNQITSLIKRLQQLPGINNPVNVTVQPAVPDANAAGAGKVQRIRPSRTVRWPPDRGLNILA